MRAKFEAIYEEVIERLTNELPSYLTYHSVDHTKYVLKMAEYLAGREGCSDADILLVKVAALFHDIGFIDGMKNHEEKGCEIAKAYLIAYGFKEKDIEIICGMIMATKIPQNPQNLLEKILADADLEYLSTQNFEPVSELLYTELKHLNPNLMRDEWNRIQIDFLSKHHYHTDFCKRYKENFKQQHLLKLKGLDLKSVRQK
ncbi:HD domain-containing protein [Arcticibacterium luteifluviistationis]|uniref:HD family phosphohydrolase n=1 Tax=Arcticibacterium luteifluviistationis TaxID=1784714 RepID=A0A2Z4G761_9BACT|nr:HD domain-containing protein [Arcticibacterium luteifluviistationis]AWV96984.1 HD family phosphohydrolase [Arcticibacterium luteifluviistationis]